MLSDSSLVLNSRILSTSATALTHMHTSKNIRISLRMSSSCSDAHILPRDLPHFVCAHVSQTSTRKWTNLCPYPSVLTHSNSRTHAISDLQMSGKKGGKARGKTPRASTPAPRASTPTAPEEVQNKAEVRAAAAGHVQTSERQY